MTKKALVLISMLMALALTGCSLFTSGSGGQDTTASGAIPIDDTVTHEDPADIDFANRYVYYSGEVCTISEVYKQDYGVLDNEFFILYSDKDDVPLRVYYYFTFAEETAAQLFADALNEEGSQVIVSRKN